MKIRMQAAVAALLVLGLVLAGCGKQAAPKTGAVQKHQHVPPHHGTPVVLGNEEYHVELVLEPATGKCDAYVLDGELENFIRVQQPSFEVLALPKGRKEILTFKAVANNSTGETVGDTSQFETQADWLKTEKEFDAVLINLGVRGNTYQDVKFNFPKGNDTDDKPKPSTSKIEYKEAGFDLLACFQATVTYDVVDADKPGFYYAPHLISPIPDFITNLDGRKVAIKGFMLPLRQNQGLVTEFILLKNQSFCCFGKPPLINEWVHVRMKGEGVKPLMDQPVSILGRLKVGSYNENKTLLGMYQMDAEKIHGPE